MLSQAFRVRTGEGAVGFKLFSEHIGGRASLAQQELCKQVSRNIRLWLYLDGEV